MQSHVLVEGCEDPIALRVSTPGRTSSGTGVDSGAQGRKGCGADRPSLSGPGSRPAQEAAGLKDTARSVLPGQPGQRLGRGLRPPSTLRGARPYHFCTACSDLLNVTEPQFPHLPCGENSAS